MKAVATRYSGGTGIINDVHVESDKILDFVKNTFTSHVLGKSTIFLDMVFARVQDLFEGRYRGYQRSDTAYHDFKHTCEATVAVVRILDGHIKSGKFPAVSSRDFELVIAAILLHDSGFIKQVGDREGTGAKYAFTHVERSQKFAANFLPGFGFAVDEIILIQLLISCTGVKVDVDNLPFYNDQERFLGRVLGTGDLLGQMAAPDYPERLSGLYEELTEAVAYSNANGNWIEVYDSAEDLMSKTRNFYESYAKQLLEQQWGGVHEALLHHFSDGKNHYFKSIEANLDHIEQRVQTASV